MDFFGFGASADLSTPIGVMVKSGTDSLLIGPDWSKNLEICEAILNTKDGPELALRAVGRRLQDSDHNTVYLALIILETCWKNCGAPFMKCFDRTTMDEVSAVAKGSKGEKNAYEALRLIQEWGREYEHQRSQFSLFFETYMNLKSKGLKFPKEEVRSSPSISQTTRNASNSTSRNVATANIKVAEEAVIDGASQLEKDLAVVMEKVRLCREMLLISPGIRHDEILSDVVGFLEACKERMSELIEAGTQGLLGEELFASCLKVNDAVIKTLDAEKNGVRISVEDESEKKTRSGDSKSPEASTGNLLDLSPTHNSASSSNSKTVDLLSATENDFFGSLDSKEPIKVSNSATKKPVVKSTVLTSAPAAAATQQQQQQQSDADPFAFDPFSIQQPAPTTVFNNTSNSSTAVPPVSTSTATMSDVDFDAFFNDLTVKK